MRQLLLFLVLFITYATTLSAQALHIDSTWFLPTVRPNTNIKFAMPTSDKGIFFVGAMVLKPGGIIPAFPLDTSLGNVMIGKMDSNRHISWVKIYGGTQDDGAFGACQTQDGGYAVLAGTNSSNGDVTGFKGGIDIWLLRIDATGNLLWQKNYGSTQSDNPISIANTPDHGFIMLGSTNGNDGDVPFHYGGFFSLDWLVVKTDSMGNVQWSKDIGGTGLEESDGSILSVDSFYYLAASTVSKDYDCSDTAWHAGINTYTDFHLVKLSGSGNVLWDKSYGGTDYDIISTALFDTRDSTIVISGTTGSNDLMVTDYKGNNDIWVVKVDKNGTLIWEKTLGSTGEEAGVVTCEASHGGYVIFGATHYVIGGWDGWLSMLDSSSNELSQKIFGGIYNDNIYSALPCSGGYAIAGVSGSPSFTEGINSNANNSGSFISYFENWPLSLDNVSATNCIGVYPNPANNVINVMIPAIENSYLSVTNLIGQVVYATNCQSKTVHIDVSDWAPGMYFTHLDGNYGILSGKFIKK